MYKKSDSTEFFATKDWLKEKLYSFIENDNVKTILDPCCGTCGLEDFSREYKYTLLDIEKRLDRDDIKQCDFFDFNSDTKFDCAVINPPFAMTKEFVEHAFKFTDTVLLIGPAKTVIKHFYKNIDDVILDWRIPYKCYGVLVSIALFKLKKRASSFGTSQESIYNKYYMKKLPEEKTFKSITVKCAEHTQNKWALVLHTTKARVVRGEKLILDSDLYAPGDDAAFIAKAANLNRKIGDRVERYIVYFDSKEQAEKFIEDYNKESDKQRNYMYQWGNNIIYPHMMPLPGIL